MNVVTGATGHIGNVLVRTLLEQGQPVRALVLPGEDCAPLAGLNVECLPGDVLDYASLAAAFAGAERVYHVAGMVSIMPGRNELLRLTNITGTGNVLHAARSAGVGRVIYTSSIHAFRRLPQGVVIDESVPFDAEHAISPYDHSKASASLAVLQAAAEGQDVLVVCPTGVIGPYDFRLSEVGRLMLDAVQGKPQLYLDGAYDFVDVRDVAAGMLQAAEHGHRGQTYILAGWKISVQELIEALRRLSGRSLLQVKVPFPLARLMAQVAPLYYRLAQVKPRLTPYALETLRSNCDISRAKAERELGYCVRPLEETLHDAMAWLRQNQVSSVFR